MTDELIIAWAREHVTIGTPTVLLYIDDGVQVDFTDPNNPKITRLTAEDAERHSLAHFQM